MNLPVDNQITVYDVASKLSLVNGHHGSKIKASNSQSPHFAEPAQGEEREKHGMSEMWWVGAVATRERRFRSSILTS